jgi:hypothetical protein
MVEFNAFHDVNLEIEFFLQLKLPLKACTSIKIIRNESLSIEGIHGKY